ncbi:hypothetical protein Tco_0321740 [Tanacetum coccineum]
MDPSKVKLSQMAEEGLYGDGGEMLMRKCWKFVWRIESQESSFEELNGACVCAYDYPSGFRWFSDIQVASKKGLALCFDCNMGSTIRARLMWLPDALSQKSGMIACFDSIILRDLERLDVGYVYEVLVAIGRNVEEGKTYMSFSVDDDGVVWFEDRSKVKIRGIVVCYSVGDSIGRWDEDFHVAEIFHRNVRLHGTTYSIVSYRDPSLRLFLGVRITDAWGNCYYVQGSWDDILLLGLEFAYQYSWHVAKGSTLELCMVEKCRAPICWDEVGERLIVSELNVWGSRASSVLDSIGHVRDCGTYWEVRIRLALPPQFIAVHSCLSCISFEGIPYHPLHARSNPLIRFS